MTKRVGHVAPTAKDAHLLTTREVDEAIEAGVDYPPHPDPQSIDTHPSIAGNTQSAGTTELSTPDELDVDLAYEHDELLKPESPSTDKSPKIWQVKASALKFSALEAVVAVKRGLFTFEDFEVYPSPNQAPDEGPADPLTGALSATLNTVGTVAQRISDYPLLLAKVLESQNDDQIHTEIAEFAKDSGKGVTGLVGAGLKAPMELTHNMARGFHNLPKMYGDEVRPVEKVTDVQSGLVAAGKGFSYGLWDGMSGLVTQPMKGAQEGGFMGGLVGFGKGLGGAVFKPAAGAFGVPGYAFKGIYEEVQKNIGSGQEKDKTASVVEAQMIQGFHEWEAASEDDRELIYKWIKREIEDLETLEG